MKIIHFADLHLGVETYGRVNPATGLSSRLEDFLSSFDQLVDYAIENSVDLVLFCGDAYKSREPSQTQQREFAQRINRLSTGNIPVFLLSGNHDMPNATGKATATEIFDTLAIKNVYVSNRPDVYKIRTKSGDVQIVSLPWLRRSTLLSTEENKNLNLDQINDKLQQVLTDTVVASIPKLNPTLPTILAAHVWVDGAKVGSEKQMTIGKEPALLASNLGQSSFDYIALGHIHQHQVLTKDPPVVYAGSLERLDFGDENDEKGFYVLEIESEKNSDNRQVSFEFQPIIGRPFLTIRVTLEAEDIDPTDTIIRDITRQGDKIKEAIVRLEIKLPAQIESLLRDADLRSALKETYYFTIARDIQRETRLRLGSWTADELTPIDALKIWLETTNASPEHTKVLLEYGEKLIEGQGRER